VTRSWKSWTLAALLALGFLWGVVSLFNRQFAAGELYPQFSTLRTDRMGTRLLYDSLGKMPGITVERNLLPMEFLPRDGATLVMLGVKPTQVNWNDGMLLQSVDKIAARGNRGALAMYIDLEDDGLKQEDLDRRETAQANGKRKYEVPPLGSMWNVRLKLDGDRKSRHPLYFDRADGWSVRETADTKMLAVERNSGKGSVLLMAESGEFTNGSAVELNRLADVCAALGPYRRIVFDEQHLGIAESGSIVGMARQFRLMGLALGLALCAALFIWKNAAGFPPPPRSRAVDRFSGRTSHSGLVTLLKRHIPPADLAAVCWKEWLSTNRSQATPEVRQRAEAILAGAAGRPVEATREIQILLGAKGEL
jgi:hypothetical protein